MSEPHVPNQPYAAYPPPSPRYAVAPAAAYAPWIRRVGATLLDGVIILPLYAVALVGLVMTGREGHASQAVGIVVTAAGYASAIGFAIWNQIIRQGRTGWSLGKKWVGIRLISETTGQPIGAGMNFLRSIVHTLDGLACYVGYLWPLWDAKRQTFADMIMKTVVICQEEPPA